MKKVTAQEMHAAYAQAMESMPVVPGVSERFQDAAKPWEHLSQEQQAIFAEMARKLNMIVGEFIVDEK